jgi:hypothetical protein
VNAPNSAYSAAAIDAFAARLLNANDTSPGTTWAEKHASEPPTDWQER